ncbi:hypothetical protein [Rubrobacter indicoceani]|uniref:hypothetical protein n=1 Tax=Rubrobacter indicoceani TaxID=2051957 RepID=UPI0013C4ACB7|nr:hypothetical protein [Rubrobacter indicoceani]
MAVSIGVAIDRLLCWGEEPVVGVEVTDIVVTENPCLRLDLHAEEDDRREESVKRAALKK